MGGKPTGGWVEVERERHDEEVATLEVWRFASGDVVEEPAAAEPAVAEADAAAERKPHG
jgi:hypothetical protein